MGVDLNERPPWSNKAARRLGETLRDGMQPPTDGPSYADVLLWHVELAAEVHERIETGNWSIVPELLATKAVRMSTELRVGSRPKTQDTLVEKLRRKPTLKLDNVQDLAGVRVDADLYLGEQTQLAREIAQHFGADESAIHDLRDGAHAGYRGVHVWLRLPAGRVEVQIRTILQSIWANVYEKLADDLGRGIRYGEPAVPPPDYDQDQIDKAVQQMHEMSEMIAAREADWQHYKETGHKAAIGTNAMQKAMMVGAFVVPLQKAGSLGESEQGGA
jgi:ppGpp synthetase/RelA/SpoT-type nucleotidyltranferase